MNGFIKFRGQVGSAIFLQPGVTGIADNLQEPGARVDSMKTCDKSERPHHRLLRHVFGVCAAAQQPTRQIERGILMRHDHPLKPLSISRLQHVRTPSLYLYRLAVSSSYSHYLPHAYPV